MQMQVITLQSRKVKVGIMRVIERKMLDAIRTGKSWELDNTRVYVNPSGTIDVHLFNNLICIIVPDDTLTVCTRWRSNTTKSRLNTILREYNLPTIHQQNFVWYIGKDGDNSLFSGQVEFNI